MKTLTKDDIKFVAIELLQSDMTVTNLDVKYDLRKRGYFATQNAIAKIMDELSLEGIFGYIYNGTYRSYFIKNLNSPLITSTNTVKKISKLIRGSKTSTQIDLNSGIRQYTNRSGKIIIGYTSNVNHKYKVFSSDKSNTDILYFDGGHSRDEMRYAFKKLTSENSYKNIRVNLI